MKVLVPVRIEEDDVKRIKNLVEEERFSSVAHFIRYATRKELKNYPDNIIRA